MRFSVWGMSGTLATQHHHDEPFVAERLRHWIAQIDQACNRFRPDSEISRLNRAGTRAMGVSAVFELALDAALRAYDETSGLCDPTVLPALVALGYDRDYDELAREGSAPACAPVLPLGPTAITWDRRAHTVALAPGCEPTAETARFWTTRLPRRPSAPRVDSIMYADFTPLTIKHAPELCE